MIIDVRFTTVEGWSLYILTESISSHVYRCMRFKYYATERNSLFKKVMNRSHEDKVNLLSIIVTF